MAVTYTPTTSRALEQAGITLNEDFHALSSDQVRALIDLADADKYRAPKSASGSRARCYYAALQRRALKNLRGEA